LANFFHHFRYFIPFLFQRDARSHVLGFREQITGPKNIVQDAVEVKP